MANFICHCNCPLVFLITTKLWLAQLFKWGHLKTLVGNAQQIFQMTVMNLFDNIWGHLKTLVHKWYVIEFSNGSYESVCKYLFNLGHLKTLVGNAQQNFSNEIYYSIWQHFFKFSFRWLSWQLSRGNHIHVQWFVLFDVSTVWRTWIRGRQKLRKWSFNR